MREHIIAVIIILFIYAQNTLASQPSYDCSNANTRVEIVICKHDSLGELDRIMAKKYFSLLGDLDEDEKKTLANTQKIWLRGRDRACRHVRKQCLAELYTKRINYFDKREKVNSDGFLQQYDTYRIDNLKPLWLNGKLIFSGYNRGGNNYDITKLDPVRGNEERIIRNVHRARYITENEKYLVVSSKASLTRPLIIYDKSSKKKINSIKLKDHIKWGKIYGNNLILVQGGHFGRSNKAGVIYFSLPDLKIVKKLTIEGGNDIQEWRDRIITIGREINIYDKDFNKIKNTERIPTSHPTRNVSCGSGPMKVYKNKLLAVTTCGSIRVYSLPELKLDYTIPSFSTHISIAVNDDLIFASPQSQGGNHDETRVFSLEGGKQYGILPVGGNKLFSENGKLIAVTTRFAKPATIVVYKYSKEKITSKDNRISNVREAYKSVQDIINTTGDIYEAIDVYNSAAAGSLIKEGNLPNDIIDILFDYAKLLSESYNEYSRATPILEYLENYLDSERIRPYIDTVRLKEKIVAYTSSDISHDIESNSSSFKKAVKFDVNSAKTVPIHFGAFSDLFKFYKNKIYVGKWENNIGVSLMILDRDTYGVINEISILPYDANYQDNIDSIAIDENYIYLSIGYRYSDPGRTNFVILDRIKEEIIERLHISGNNSRITQKPYNFDKKAFCQTYYPVPDNLDDYTCTHKYSRSKKLIKIKRELPRRFILQGETQYYLVGKKRLSSRDETSLKFIHRDRDVSNKEKSFKGDVDIYPLSNDDKLLLKKHEDGTYIFLLYDIEKDDLGNIIQLKSYHNKYPIPVVTEKYLFIAYGRDLIVIDLDKNAVLNYFSNYIEEGFSNNGHGVDKNKISRLIVDRNHLISLTFSGGNSRIAELDSLTKR